VASEGTPNVRRRVLFVCHANTGRSIIAEALLKKMLRERRSDDVLVRSGGIAPYARDSSLVSLDSRLVLRDEGIELPLDATSCDLKAHREHIADADLIVVMTTDQKRMLTAQFVEAAGKEVVTLRELAGEHGDIDDPAGQGGDFYSACRDEIRRTIPPTRRSATSWHGR
jgi:protein-tyrosine-phosphatase